MGGRYAYDLFLSVFFPVSLSPSSGFSESKNIIRTGKSCESKLHLKFTSNYAAQKLYEET